MSAVYVSHIRCIQGLSPVASIDLTYSGAVSPNHGSARANIRRNQDLDQSSTSPTLASTISQLQDDKISEIGASNREDTAGEDAILGSRKGRGSVVNTEKITSSLLDKLNANSQLPPPEVSAVYPSEGTVNQDAEERFNLGDAEQPVGITYTIS